MIQYQKFKIILSYIESQPAWASDQSLGKMKSICPEAAVCTIVIMPVGGSIAAGSVLQPSEGLELPSSRYFVGISLF